MFRLTSETTVIHAPQVTHQPADPLHFRALSNLSTSTVATHDWHQSDVYYDLRPDRHVRLSVFCHNA